MGRMILTAIAGLVTLWALTRVTSAPDPYPTVMQDTQESNVVTSAGNVSSERADRRNGERREILRRIAESGTYLPAMLERSDSLLRRWDNRLREPLRVYFEPTDVRGYNASVDLAAREAFARWRRVADIPVSFVFVREPDDADVRVRWVESFPMARAGQAEVVWQTDGWIREGTLTLATHSHRGRPLRREAIFTVALHEIGHLLGLGHSDDPRDVMYSTTSVHDLTIRDRRTAKMLYRLPPGSLKHD